MTPMTFSCSLRTMRLNIWAAIQSASSTEIQEGMSFYDGAHGLCRLFSKASNGRVTVAQAAGVYAALSPMNGWETNVANALTVIKWTVRDKNLDCKCEEPWPVLLDHGSVACDRCGQQHSIHTNTPRINQQKALAIAGGAEPLDVLRGRKVRAFFRGIADPSDTSPIAVDRHLICLALGNKLGKSELSRAASNPELYSRVESVYSQLGRREGVGNRLASIAWFVQRRVTRSRNHQLTLTDPTSPVCCGRIMNSHGTKPRRFACPVCEKTRTPVRPSRPVPAVLLDDDIRALIDRNGYSLHLDSRGRVRIQLGEGHYAAASGGTQYLSRFITMYTTGERLHRDEHVHHSKGNLLDHRRDELEVWDVEEHGRFHARAQLLYMLRDRVSGRFVPSEVPDFETQYSSNQTPDDQDIPF